MRSKRTKKKSTQINKKTIRPEMADSSSRKKPLWCFDRVDREGEFAFDPSRKDFDAILLFSKLISLSGLTWQEIIQATHDDGKSKNHAISADDFSDAARKRFNKLNLDEEEDSLFSVAITNKIRVFGIKQGAEFHIIWYDPEHRICPIR